ncbi:MAG TPA: hypothetical protein VLA89_13220 [Gemmatimonadales bacterium]|nr:hypothetical protein [Gemmatimonadales bacterium]
MTKHRYLITEEPAGYVWSCSCGKWDFKPTNYKIARAGVKRHLRASGRQVDDRKPEADLKP